MLELGVLVLVAIGACWLFGALIAGLFKLTFGFVGVLFGGLSALFALGMVALLVVPIILFALLPLLLPVLLVVAVVWLIAHASKSRVPPAASQARGVAE